VPKFHLKRFSNAKGQLLRQPLGGADSHLISLNDATVQTDFYKIEQEGREADAFEKTLSKHEGEFATALTSVLDDERWPPSAEDRTVLAVMVALQYLRSHATRTSGQEIERATAKLEVGIFTRDQIRERLKLPPSTSDEEVENLRARMLATADTFKVDSTKHLKLIADSLEGMTNLVFYRRPWKLVRFSRKSVGIADTPVVLIPYPKSSHPHLGGTGLGTAMHLYLPLDRRTGLYMGELPPAEKAALWPSDSTLPASTAMAKRLNGYTLWNARKEVFQHPDDTPFDSMEIPAPRDSEMLIPHDQINELIEAFARRQGRPSGLPNTAEQTEQPG
jgi:hypothetical protein